MIFYFFEKNISFNRLANHFYKVIQTMNLPTVITFFSFLLFSTSIIAQESDTKTTKKPIQLKSKSASAAYYSPGFGYTGGSNPSYIYRVGYFGIEQKVSFFGDNLREEVKDNPEALEQMNIFAKKKKNLVAGYVVAGSGIVLTAFGLEKTGQQTFDPRTNQYQDKYGLKPIGIMGMGMAFTGIIVAIVNGSSATKYIENAVEAYNNGLDLTSEEGTTVMKINFAPTINPNFVGAGFKVSLF